MKLSELLNLIKGKNDEKNKKDILKEINNIKAIKYSDIELDADTSCLVAEKLINDSYQGLATITGVYSITISIISFLVALMALAASNQSDMISNILIYTFMGISALIIVAGLIFCIYQTHKCRDQRNRLIALQIEKKDQIGIEDKTKKPLEKPDSENNNEDKSTPDNK